MPYIDISQSYRLDYQIPNTQPFRGLYVESLLDITLSNTITIPAEVSERFCGNTYLIVDIDYLNMIQECNEENNIAVSSFVLDCPGDIFQLQLISHHINPSPFWITQQFLVTMRLEMRCWLDTCMSVATHTIAGTRASHYFLDLMVNIHLTF